MQVNVQKLSPVLVEFDVQVEVDRVRTEMDKAYADLAKRAKVRGFRPGRAPKRVLQHMFGARVAADVAQRLVDETFPKAVSEQRMQPINQPAFEPQALRETQPFQYKVRFEIIPAIDSVTYDGLKAKKPKVDVQDDAIDKEVEVLRKAHSTLEPLAEPRPSAAGDVATVDFEVEIDGERIAEAATQGIQVEIGSGQLMAPLDEALKGREAGAVFVADVDMPEAHPHPKFRGKRVQFHVTLKELKARVLPAADDELAKDVGDFETLDALRADIRERLEKQAKEQADNAVAEQLVAELVKANEIPVPPSLVERQMRVTEQEILQHAKSQGQNATGLGEQLRSQVRQDSEVKVRAGLLMAEIAKKEAIRIGDEQLEEGLKELAEQTGKNVAKLRAEYREPRMREMLIGMILENKVLDIIEAKANIEEE